MYGIKIKRGSGTYEVHPVTVGQEFLLQLGKFVAAHCHSVALR